MEETKIPKSEGQEGLGHRLQQARNSRNLDQQAAANGSGIPLRAVSALEAEDFASLEAPVYVRGYLRKYASWLGLPAEELVDLYERTASVAEPQVLARFSEQPIRSEAPSWLLPASLVIGFVVAGLLAFFGWRHFHRSNLLTQIPPTAVSAAIASSASLPGTVSSSSDAASAATSNTGFNGQESAAVSAATIGTGVKAAAGPSTHLSLKVIKASWVEVKNATNKKRLYYNLAAPGSDLHFSFAGDRITVFLGNARGVKVTINGKPYDIPTADYRGKTARFSIVARAPHAATTAAH